MLARTSVGRDINRPYLDRDRVGAALAKPVVQALTSLIRLRNSSKAFDGEFSVRGQAGEFCLSWSNGSDSAALEVNLATKSALITLVSGEEQRQICLAKLLNC